MGERAISHKCVAAPFGQVEYHPAEQTHALWQLRLPQPGGPGFEFDGTRCNYPADALAELARGTRASEPRERPIEIELRPAPSIAADEGVAA
jgi:hypothetical protein